MPPIFKGHIPKPRWSLEKYLPHFRFVQMRGNRAGVGLRAYERNRSGMKRKRAKCRHVLPTAAAFTFGTVRRL